MLFLSPGSSWSSWADRSTRSSRDPRPEGEARLILEHNPTHPPEPYPALSSTQPSHPTVLPPQPPSWLPPAFTLCYGGSRPRSVAFEPIPLQFCALSSARDVRIPLSLQVTLPGKSNLSRPLSAFQAQLKGRLLLEAAPDLSPLFPPCSSTFSISPKPPPMPILT